MVTHKEAAVPVDPQGCTAAVAVGHDGIIGEAGATDRETSLGGPDECQSGYEHLGLLAYQE